MVLHYSKRPSPIAGQGGAAGAGGQSIVTSSYTDGVKQQAQAQPPAPIPTPATAVTTPVKPATATGGGAPPTPAAARLNLTGNAKAPAGTAALLDLASGAAVVNEKMKEALKQDPSLMDVLDDGRFFRGKQLSPQQECFPMTAEELEYAIEETDCVLVHLAPSDNTPDNPYRLNRQINVTHSVILQGDTLEDQPFIDCFDAVRCFRVFPGVYFTMRYVGINQGTGEYRDAIPFLEGVPTTPTGMVLESRGGTILFDPGSLGGLFVGCMFFDDMSGEEEIELLIELNLALVSVRIYGGFIFVGGGTLQFIGCLFWDYEIIAANDRIYLGGDVLVLAGQASFTGCVWVYTTWFAGEHGAGFNIAMINGVSLFTFCQFTEFNAFMTTDGVGQAFLVVGGVQTLTGVSLSYFTIALLFTGTGELTVFGGAQISTGVSVFDQFATMASFGAGLDYCVGGGVLIHVGTAVNQYSGPVNSGMVGGYAFLGGGVYHATASPVVETASTASEFGAGSVAFIGGGIGTFISCPVVDMAGIGLGFFAGEYIYVGKGFLVWLFSPTTVFSAIDYFDGWGGFIFVGVGAAMMGFSPTYQQYFITDEAFDYWVMGSCEPEGDAWAPMAPFLVTLNYAGPNSGGYKNCFNRTSAEGARVRALLEEKEKDQMAEVVGSTPEAAAAAVVAAEAFRRQLAATAGEGSGRDRVGFSLFNSSKMALDLGDAAMVAQLKQYGVQDKALQAARMFQQALGPSGLAGGALDEASEQKKTKEKQPALYVNSPVDGYCGVCGVEGGVGGPGAASCEYQDSCDGAKPPPGFEGLVDFNAISYKERFLILGHMESTTRPDVSSDPYLNYTAAGRRRLAEARAPIAMLRNADLEEALKAAVLAAFGDGNDANKDAAPIADGTEDPLHVAVWSAEPDPLFKELYPELLPSAGVSEEFGTTHRHNVAIITTSKANADAIIAALQATPPPPADGAGPGRPEGGGKKRRGRGRRRGQVVEGYTPEGESGGVGQGGEVAPGVVEGYQAGTSKWGGSQKPDVEVRAQEAHGRMEEGVKAEVKGKKGIDLGFVGLSYKRTLYVPPYNSKKMTEKSTAQSLGPLTVALVDAEVPGLPVTHVEYKKPYRIHLEQFSPNAKLHLQIVGVPERPDGLSALGGSAPVVKRTIAGSALGGAVGLNALVADAEGTVDLEYRFRLLDAPAGDYALQATDVATGMAGQSLPFVLSAKRRRRKLYGPIMHV